MKHLVVALLMAVLSFVLIACGPQEQPASATEPPSGEVSGEISGEVASSDAPAYQQIIIIRDELIEAIVAAGLPDPTTLPEGSYQIAVSSNGAIWQVAVAEPRYIDSEVYLYPGTLGIEFLFEAGQTVDTADRYRVQLIRPRDMNAGVFEITGSDPTAINQSGQLVAQVTSVTNGDSGERAGVDYADMVQGTLWLASPIGDTVTGGYQVVAANDAGEQVTATGVFHQLLKESEWWFRGWGDDQFSRPAYRPHGGGVTTEPALDRDIFRVFLRHRAETYSAEIIFELPLDIQTGNYDFTDLDINAFVIGGNLTGSYQVANGWLSVRRYNSLIDGTFEFQAIDDFSDLIVTVEGGFKRAPIPQVEG